MLTKQQFKKLLFSSPLIKPSIFLLRIRVSMAYQLPQLKRILIWLATSKEVTNFTYGLDSNNRLQLASIISLITQVDTNKVLSYFEEIEQDIDLRELIKTSICQGNSLDRNSSDANVQYGRRIGWYAFVRILKPKVVIETGIDKGLGSCVICSALLRNQAEGHSGQYYGTDINPDAGFLFTSPYDQVGKILYGDSIESLQLLSESIDLFINDSDHSADYEMEEYKVIQEKLSLKSVILGDNSHETDKLQRFAMNTNRKFIFFKEKPKKHWYPGGGIGIAWS